MKFEYGVEYFEAVVSTWAPDSVTKPQVVITIKSYLCHHNGSFELVAFSHDFGNTWKPVSNTFISADVIADKTEDLADSIPGAIDKATDFFLKRNAGYREGISRCDLIIDGLVAAKNKLNKDLLS